MRRYGLGFGRGAESDSFIGDPSKVDDDYTLLFFQSARDGLFRVL